MWQDFWGNSDESSQTTSSSTAIVDASATSSTSSPQMGDLAFWSKMRDHPDGGNTLGLIELGTQMEGSDQLKDPGKNNGGLLYVRAIPYLDNAKLGLLTADQILQDSLKPAGDRNYRFGYTLKGSRDRTPDSVPVYFLPWKQDNIVFALREWYEHSLCDFFITSKLTGCRFVLTHNEVLHIASQINGAKPHESHKRSAAEAAFLDPAKPRRRYSYTGSNPALRNKSDEEEASDGAAVSASSSVPVARGPFGYGGRSALVFGAKMADGSWIYKALSYELRDTAGHWEELVVPGN